MPTLPPLWPHMTNTPIDGMAHRVGDADTQNRGHGPELRIDLVAGPYAVREALVALAARLQDWNVSKARIDDTQTVLAEVLNNIVEHAYDPGAGGAIRIDVRLEAGQMHVMIRDTGRQMPANRLPVTEPPDPRGLELQDWPEGGFGWLLIREMTTALDYQRVDGENRLFLQIQAEDV